MVAERCVLLLPLAWLVLRHDLGNPLMVASVGIYVQAFFLWRLYMISGRKWLPPALLSPVLLLAYAAVALAVR